MTQPLSPDPDHIADDGKLVPDAFAGCGKPIPDVTNPDMWFLKYCEVMEKIDDMCSFYGGKGVSKQFFEGEKVAADFKPRLAIELAFNETVAGIRKAEQAKLLEICKKLASGVDISQPKMDVRIVRPANTQDVILALTNFDSAKKNCHGCNHPNCECVYSAQQPTKES